LRLIDGHRVAVCRALRDARRKCYGERTGVFLSDRHAVGKHGRIEEPRAHCVVVAKKISVGARQPHAARVCVSDGLAKPRCLALRVRVRVGQPLDVGDSCCERGEHAPALRLALHIRDGIRIAQPERLRVRVVKRARVA